MAIEFIKCVVNGVNYLSVTVDNNTKALLGEDGCSLIMINHSMLTDEEAKMVFAEMKKLRPKL